MDIERYGRLSVLSKNGTKWTCRCDCGTVKTVRRKEILRRVGALQSCGCLQRETVAAMGRERNRTHGLKDTATYRSWSSMRNRCNNPSNVAYSNYGGRGISVVSRWDSFTNFLEDMGERPEGCSIDRIDNDGNYGPENCRWANAVIQGRNRRSNTIIEFEGSSFTLVQAAELYGIPRHSIKYRLAAGWTVYRALMTPVDVSKRSVKPR